MTRKLTSTLIAGLLVFTFSLPTFASLTESTVEAMIGEIARAAKSTDTDGIVVHFAAEAQITLDMPEDLGGKMELSTAQYKRMLDFTWSMVSTYEYEIKDQTITMADDGESAIVEGLIVETVNVNGQTITQVTAETIEVELRDGQPKVTKIHATLKQ